METSSWSLSKKETLKDALHRSRSETKNRGHDWDVADVMDVLEEQGIFKLPLYKN